MLESSFKMFFQNKSNQCLDKLCRLKLHEDLIVSFFNIQLGMQCVDLQSVKKSSSNTS